MQSQEKKIKRLLESKDVENHKLGQLALLSVLDKDNALYWYLTLEPIKSSIKADEITTTKTKYLKYFSETYFNINFPMYDPKKLTAIKKGIK